MRPAKFAIALVGGCVLGFSALASDAVDPNAKNMTGASAEMLANTCAGCHGTKGASEGPAIPSLAGMSASYMKELMEGYKSGEVKAGIMDRVAKGYSEEEIALMADFFSKQPMHMPRQSFDAAKAKKGAELHDKYCEKCHSENGTVKEDESGQLGGQLTPYLRYSMEDFRAADRPMPKKMKKKVQKLLKKEGDAGIEDLLNYYASIAAK